MTDVVVSIDDRIMTVTLDRRDRRNAVSASMLEKLVAVFEEVDRERVRCAVLRGAGDEAFCSGYDLAALPTDVDADTAFEGPELLMDACDAISECPVPTVAALKGSCFGAGGELAVACDLRLAADDLKFGMPPAKLGIVYQQDGLARFVRELGYARTKEIFFTGATWDAQDAVRLGFVNRVYGAASFFDDVRAFAATIVDNAPLAVQGMKRIIDSVAETDFTAVEEREFDRLRLQAFQSDDYREGVKAMSDKRRPAFSGR